MTSVRLAIACLAAVFTAGCASARPPADSVAAEAIREQDTYSRDTVLKEAEAVFGVGAAGLGGLIELAFSRWGRPTGFIAGEEAAGALVFGLRYGHGSLRLKSGEQRDVWWQGPSIGFDTGGNAAKVFVLVYNVTDPVQVFQRYPGVDGSAYFVGGLGMNYHRSGDIALAPIRLGVGWRLGASVGYLHLTPYRSLIPF